MKRLGWANGARRSVRLESWTIGRFTVLRNSPTSSREWTVVDTSLLDLTVSLRSRQAERLHDWVIHLLNGSAELARGLAPQVRESFVMYLTRNLEPARRYCDQRYTDDPVARYGLLASSHAKLLPEFGLKLVVGNQPHECCQVVQRTSG